MSDVRPVDAAPDRATVAAAARRCGADAADRRAPPPLKAAISLAATIGDARRRDRAARDRNAGGASGGDRHLPAVELAGAVRHRARRRPAVGVDAGADRRRQLAAALFSLGRWHRAGVHYHTLFQIQLMGVNGAFLTGDLFNLFVFFEVMLAASYGLLLAWLRHARASRGSAVHRVQPARIVAVPRRHRNSLRRHGHAQHGRHRAEDSADCRRGPRPAARRRRDSRHRRSREGGDVAAELLARCRVFGGGGAGGGAVRRC